MGIAIMTKLLTSNETLAARVERAAHMAYLQGATEIEIAKAVGIKPVTLRDWKKRSEWAAAICELRAQQRHFAFDRLATMTSRAVGAIEECLKSDNDAVKLKAAVWVLERGVCLGKEADIPLTDAAAGEIRTFVRAVTDEAGDRHAN